MSGIINVLLNFNINFSNSVIVPEFFWPHIWADQKGQFPNKAKAGLFADNLC